jgi:biotin carboxyl carrier protein/acetyl-CoA carboxylase beta subunit
VEERIGELVAADVATHPRLFFDRSEERLHAGAKVDAVDPLAVLTYGKTGGGAPAAAEAAEIAPASHHFDMAGLENTLVMKASMQGTIVSIDVHEGQLVREGQQILVMNSMKMEHVIGAEASGRILRLTVEEGDTVFEGQPLAFIQEQEVEEPDTDGSEQIDLDELRADLAEVQRRHEITLDAARPEAVAKRRERGQRTARMNISDLCDPGTYVEYGPLVIAAQRRRRSLEDLIQRTPADGLVAGVGSVNGHLFGERKARCVIISYDYMVLAGTQGQQNHKKKDRMFELAEQWGTPLILFTEGGGGRPGDTDSFGVAGLDCMAFHLFGKLSGRVPLIGINSGRCFAGNAALLGCCDVVIATENSNIGMGGPAMIEGGGLGVFRPEEIGPMSVQVPNGVVDIGRGRGGARGQEIPILLPGVSRPVGMC